MIKNKEDYKRYLLAEHKVKGSMLFIRIFFSTFFKPTLKFLLYLRTCEYLKNSNRGLIYKMGYLAIKFLKYRLGIRLGFSIPENVVEEGLQLPYYGTIVINAGTRMGKYCRIHVCVNIGSSGIGTNTPKIGNHVYIGPGAKIYGNIKIADRIAIALNAAVSKSFEISDKLIGGVPAKELGDFNVFDLIKI